jgi:hypothetical protein
VHEDCGRRMYGKTERCNDRYPSAHSLTNHSRAGRDRGVRADVAEVWTDIPRVRGALGRPATHSRKQADGFTVNPPDDLPHHT